jgi:hypothetical protein
VKSAIAKLLLFSYLALVAAAYLAGLDGLVVLLVALPVAVGLLLIGWVARTLGRSERRRGKTPGEKRLRQ